MKRYTGQKALYEAIAKTQAKYRRRGILERLHPGNGGQEAEPPAVEEPKPQAEPVRIQVEPLRPPVERPVAEKLPEPLVKPVRPVERPEPQPRPVQPRLRPKAVQVHDGRIEISLPYTIGVTVLLISVLLVLGAFRLGQMQHRYRLPAVNSSVAGKVKTPAPAPKVEPEVKQSPARAEPPAPAPGVEAVASDADVTTAPATVQGGDHVIVLAQHAQREPLDAVKAYFGSQGIATEVISVAKLRDYLVGQGINAGVLGTRGGFMLVTARYYDNPQNQGTDGYKAKQEIIEVGRRYKPKSASESFPNYFSDAYGMKVR